MKELEIQLERLYPNYLHIKTNGFSRRDLMVQRFHLTENKVLYCRKMSPSKKGKKQAVFYSLNLTD